MTAQESGRDRPEGGWSEDAWERVSPWFTAIKEHPFLVALADGTLGEDVFCRYLLDDAHYLVGYSRALATLSSRVPDTRGAKLLAHSAASALEAERGLHAAFLLPRGIDPDSPDAREASPTCRGYVGSLQIAAAYSSVEVGTAAILPCFRVYAEVGRSILATAPAAGHPYRTWIDTYADPDFEQAVREAEAYVDELAAATTPRRRDAMLTAYVEATRYEWMFWDAAWRDETWPST